ncbi:MAG: PEGA domain-containing protein, partial [Proteobacteria bacterium]|nr:PEGA domain-containing protein [Pseudomonadota bacterium]
MIRVTSDPIESRIFIDAKDTFQSTDTSLQVDPGEHTLTLKKQGFLDKEIEFEIKEGESLLFNL